MLKSNNNNDSFDDQDDQISKRTKMRKMLFAIICFILIIVIIAVICVFLLVTSNKSDDSNNTIYLGYKLVSILQNDTRGIQAQLQYQCSDDYYVNNKFSPIIKNLRFSLSFDSNEELTMKFIDPDNTRFILPYKAPFPFTKVQQSIDSNSTKSLLYDIDLIFNPFSLRIKRKNTNESIFDSTDLNFVYSDRYLEFSTFLPSKHLYGLGERRQGFLYQPGTYTIWPKDQYATIDNATGPNHQTYGHHPMYLMREKSGNFHVFFLRNANAMDCIISGGSKVLTFKITGGIMEMKFFLGDRYPETALKAYHTYINGYTMMPFWSLGYHQSRWGYKTSKELLSVVNKFENYDIPLDTIWSDIDYMNLYRDFSINSNFKRIDFDEIFNKSIQWVPILDIGIYKDSNISSPYQRANLYDIFIKSSFNETPLLACVWPGLVSFPDFNHPNTSKFWGLELASLHSQIPFSGIWLDMNEPANFIEGEIRNESQNCAHPIDSQRLFEEIKQDQSSSNKSLTHNLYIYSKNLPYIPGEVLLENKTISMNATHYIQGVYLQSTEPITELDFHSLNGFLESKTTHDYLKANLSKGLPFVLSRSNMFGQGAFSFHWTGDNYADWSFLQTSISEIFNFQLFGMPFTGVDLCGFAGNTTEELCARFMQAGALYPFSRNHNSIDARDQEPYAWGTESPVFKASKSSLKLRYSILKWYYSVFVRNNGTGSVFRPLFFEFPEDPYLYELDNQFLIGDELMVAPVVEPNITMNWVYFTNNSRWFDFFNGSISYDCPTSSMLKAVPAPLDGTPPIFIRAGRLIYTQKSSNIIRSNELLNNFALKIALDDNLMSTGYILGLSDYNNDSNVIEACLGKNNCLLKVIVSAVKINDHDMNFTILFQKTTSETIIQENYITEIEIFGVPFENSFHTVNYKPGTSFLIKDNVSLSFFYSLNSYYKLSSYSFNGKKLIGTLIYQGSENYYNGNVLSPIIKNLTLTVSYDSQNELTIILDDSVKPRFTLPYKTPFPFTKSVSFPLGGQIYRFEIPQGDRFGLKIIRNKTNETIWDLCNYLLIYSDHYLQLTTSLPTEYLYGLGERRQGFLYKDGLYTIWAKDMYVMMDNGTPNHQTYGQHPAYLMREAINGDYHLCFLRNNHAMDIAITDNVSKLTYHIIGGTLELKFFLGNTKPDSVLKAFHSYLNGYIMMPFWALGYHQSRWGYNSSSILLQVVQNFSKLDIPLDTIWSDIDYMDNFEDFTIGPAFKRNDFDRIRNDYSVNWVPILDIGIAEGNGSNPAYMKGLELDIYVKSSMTNKSLLNCVWPGRVSYPDFNHPNISIFWQEQLKKLHDLIPYDGLWLDMNEPSAFIDGELNPNDKCPPPPMINSRILSEISSNQFFDNDYFYSKDLPYVPGVLPLENNTISMNATHYEKGVYVNKNDSFTEFHYHGLSGYLESYETYRFMKTNLSIPFPFILSRSTLFSQGAFSSHWSGDNLATWAFFQTSISEIFNFQIFGMPFIGVDLCGFGGDTTEELCSRWMQAGALYPFSRNHNQIYMIPQEPYAWGVNSTVYQASQKTLKLRYSILKWYYSIFARNNGTGSVFKPLFFEFSELEAMKIEDQFLLGKELMVAPVMKPNTTTRNVYFPGYSDVWFDYLDNSKVYHSGFSVGIFNDLNGTPPVFQKDGTIIYTQKTETVKNVKDLNNVFTFKVALKKNQNNTFVAEGFMMGIENYTNSGDVEKLCTGINDCLLKITADGFVDQNNKLNITIGLNKFTDVSNVQLNYVGRVEVIGIVRSDGKYDNYSEDFTTMMVCSDGMKINRVI